MPGEPSWWAWLLIEGFLVSGLAGVAGALPVAAGLAGAQAAFLLGRHRSVAPYPVQIRLAYAALLAVCLLPALNWLAWLPAVGTGALLAFGYCLLARVLSLMPWNRSQPLDWALVRRALFSPPVPGHPGHGLPGVAACPGGVCEREASAAFRQC